MKSEAVAEGSLIGFTKRNQGIAVAECAKGLGCTVYADGKTIVWAGPQVENLVGVYLQNGAIITSKATLQYFLLRWNGMRELSVLEGPLSADKLELILNG